jgi:hypothetical protein
MQLFATVTMQEAERRSIEEEIAARKEALLKQDADRGAAKASGETTCRALLCLLRCCGCSLQARERNVYKRAQSRPTVRCCGGGVEAAIRCLLL